MTMDWEQAVVTAYGRNLTVALPTTILAIKLVVRVIARERKQDVFRSVLVLPLDFVYIAMGLVLAAVARRDSAMVARYGANIDMAVLVLMLGLMSVAILLTLCDRLVRVMWGKFFAAW